MEKINFAKQNIIDSSFKSILRISIPIILSTLSTNLMYFIDRMILAGYSTEAMYASITSGNFVAVFSWMFVGIASASEVFVGQFNGSKQYDKLVIPVWQMIYMSMMSIVLFFPMGYFSEYINSLPDFALKEGLDYQRPLFYFGFLPGLIAGLSAFFIGQGKTRIITTIVLSGNLLNALLSYFLVFKLNKGTFGAAIGTIISQFFQVLILACIFFNKKNRLSFNTLRSRSFNKKIFIDCFRIGVPVSISNFFAILAWYLIITVAGLASKELGIVWGIASNIYILMSFFSEGLNKAIATMTSNMIGKQALQSIEVIYKKFMLLLVIFCSLLTIPMVFFPDIGLSILNIIREDALVIRDKLLEVLKLSLITVFLESAEYTTWGLLLAGGDTKYPMVVSQICLWGGVVVPVAVLYHIGSLSSIKTIFSLMILCFAMSFFLIYKRYKSLKWYKKLV